MTGEESELIWEEPDERVAWMKDLAMAAAGAMLGVSYFFFRIFTLNMIRSVKAQQRSQASS